MIEQENTIKFRIIEVDNAQHNMKMTCRSYFIQTKYISGQYNTGLVLTCDAYAQCHVIV